MERYENSSIYPLSETAIDSIAANMAENGFDPDFPILVKDSQIIDGWHRYQAAARAGVDPIFREFDGDDDEILRYVLRANGDRRHLNEGQRASAAVMINRRLGKNAKDIATLAKTYGVKEGTVNRLVTYSDDELQDIVTGRKTQEAVKEQKSKSRGQPTTYALTKSQSAKIASLSVQLDERGKRLVSRAFDLGLRALEEQVAASAAAQSN